ncbi:MAG: hypothetical protein WDM87_18580 [Terracidiphilus sp.]
MPRIDARYCDGVHDLDIQRAIATVLLPAAAPRWFITAMRSEWKPPRPRAKRDVKDPIGITGWPKEKGRDGERTPMQWDGNTKAGFTTGTPWLPVPPSAKTLNVRAEKNDPNSLLTWYKTLIR